MTVYWEILNNSVLFYIGEDGKKYSVRFCALGSSFSAPRPIEYSGDNLIYNNLQIDKRIWKYTDNGKIYSMVVDVLDTKINKRCSILFSLPETNQDQYLKIFDQIISTFRFTQ